MRKTLVGMVTYLALQTAAPAYAQGYNPAINPDYTRKCAELATLLKKDLARSEIGDISYNGLIPLSKAKEIFPGANGYDLVKTVRGDYSYYAFYKKRDSKVDWDLVLVQSGGGGVISAYYKNGPAETISARGTRVINGHDLAFRFNPGNLIDILSQAPDSDKLKEEIRWAYYTCGDGDRKSFVKVFNSGKKAYSKRKPANAKKGNPKKH